MRWFAKLLISNVQRGKVYYNINHGTSKTRNQAQHSRFLVIGNVMR